MNTIQLNTNTQSSLPSDPSQSVKPPTTEDFEQQLFVAQKDTQWFTEIDAQSEKERVQKEQSEQKRLDEALENEKAAELMSMATMAKTQLNDSTETMRIVDDIENESLQRQTMSKQETFNKAVQEKVSVQKAHLVTPTVPGEDTAEQSAVKFSELLTKGSEDTTYKPVSDLKNLAQKPEAPNTTANSAKLAALPQMNDLFQRSQSSNGMQNLVNTQDLQLNRQVAKNISEGQSSNLGQKNQTEKGLISRSGTRTATSRGTSSTPTFSASVELGKSDGSAQTKSLDSRAPTQVNVSDVVGKVKLMISTKTNEIVMRLAPEHLGKLEIKLKKEGDKYAGRFKVESSEAKKALESQISQLQQGLAEQGIHIEEFSILVNEQGANESTHTFADGKNQQQNSQESRSGNSVEADPAPSNVESTVSAASQTDSGFNLYI